MAAVDFERNGYLDGTAQGAALHTSQALVQAWDAVPDDPGLAARWASLAHLDRSCSPSDSRAPRRTGGAGPDGGREPRKPAVVASHGDDDLSSGVTVFQVPDGRGVTHQDHRPET